MPDERALQDTHPADAAPPDCLGRIYRAIDFILANLDNSHTLDDVARAVHVSPFHFHRVWLPASGYLPDDQPCFEAWVGRPFAHGQERFELAVQLPVCRA